jgi:hypothetical protein
VARLAEDARLRSRLIEHGGTTADRFSEEAFNQRVEEELRRALG